MARCKQCGCDAWPNKYVCQACHRKWREARHAAYAQATSELGPMTAENHADVVKRVKQLEKGTDL